MKSGLFFRNNAGELVVNFLLAIVAALIVRVSLPFYFGKFSISDIIYVSLIAFKIFGVYFLVKYGEIKGTVFWRMLQLCYLLMFAAFLFKILHLKFAIELWLLSGVSSGIFYFIWFLTKKTKQLLDYLKASWMLTFNISIPLILFHAISEDYIYISEGIFWFMFIDFLIIQWKCKNNSQSTEPKGLQ